MNLPKLMKVKDAADILQFGKTLVHEMLRQNEMPCIKFRTEIRLWEEDLLLFPKEKSSIGNSHSGAATNH